MRFANGDESHERRKQGFEEGRGANHEGLL